MRLFEMSTLPKKAGKAVLNFIPKKEAEGTLPYRQAENIFLPRDSRLMEFYPLSKGTQFLILFPDFSSSRSLRIQDYRTWFGGTDENPFLVRLNEELGAAFLKDGEEAFFRHLVPSPIANLEAETGKEVRRQGDIFALPYSYSWEEINVAHKVINGMEIMPKEEKSLELFGTRHRLKGRTLWGSVKINGSGEYVTLGEGTITAEDHSPMTLKGVHVLDQAYGLFDSKSAD